MNKMQTFQKPPSSSNDHRLLTTALLCCILLYLPHCAVLLPEGTPVIDEKAPQPPPPPPPPPERTIFLWASNCPVQGDMDSGQVHEFRGRHSIWRMRWNADAMTGGRNAAHNICAAAYMGSVDMAGQDNIAGRIPASSLIHRAILNTNGSSLNADDIIPMGADREERPVRRPDDTPIANNWNDLFDPLAIPNIVSINEHPPHSTTGGWYWTGILAHNGGTPSFSNNAAIVLLHRYCLD